MREISETISHGQFRSQVPVKLWRSGRPRSLLEVLTGLVLERPGFRGVFICVPYIWTCSFLITGHGPAETTELRLPLQKQSRVEKSGTRGNPVTVRSGPSLNKPNSKAGSQKIAMSNFAQMAFVIGPSLPLFRRRNHHVYAAPVAGQCRPCGSVDVVLCGVLAENENHDGDAGRGGTGNTHLRVRLRSQRKDKLGPSYGKSQNDNISNLQQRYRSSPIANGQQFQGAPRDSRTRLASPDQESQHHDRQPEAKTRRSTIKTTEDRADPLRPPVRDAMLAVVPSLRAFAISFTGNVDRADDLVQETLLRAIANINSFQPGTNMSAWLFTILRNVFRSDYRRRRREVEDTDGSYVDGLKSLPRAAESGGVRGIPRRAGEGEA